MNRNHLLLACFSASVIAAISSFPTNANADEPICYMRTTKGELIDLTKLCGRRDTTRAVPNPNSEPPSINEPNYSENTVYPASPLATAPLTRPGQETPDPLPQEASVYTIY